MSQAISYKHYMRALSRWPKDVLRPECQFQEVMRKRLDRRLIAASPPGAAEAVAKSALDEQIESEQANAMYSLLENRYSRHYPLKGSLMNPPSNPTYFADLIREMEEAPQRSWWEHMTKKWKGMIRF